MPTTPPSPPELTQGAARPAPAATTAPAARPTYPRNTLCRMTAAATAAVLAQDDAMRAPVTAATVKATRGARQPGGGCGPRRHHHALPDRRWRDPPAPPGLRAVLPPARPATPSSPAAGRCSRRKAKDDAARAVTAAAAAGRPRTTRPAPVRLGGSGSVTWALPPPGRRRCRHRRASRLGEDPAASRQALCGQAEQLPGTAAVHGRLAEGPVG